MQHERLLSLRDEWLGPGAEAPGRVSPDPPVAPSRELRLGLLVAGILVLLPIGWSLLARVPAVQTFPAVVTTPLAVSIRSPMEGRIARIHVADGDQVRQGDPLLEIVNDEDRLRLAALDDRLADLGREKGWLEAVLMRLEAEDPLPALAAISAGAAVQEPRVGPPRAHGAEREAGSVHGGANKGPRGAHERPDEVPGRPGGAHEGPGGAHGEPGKAQAQEGKGGFLPGKGLHDGKGNVPGSARQGRPARVLPQPVVSRGAASSALAYWHRVLLDVADKERDFRAALAGFDRRLKAIDGQLAATRRERDLLARQIGQISPLARAGRVPRSGLDGLRRAEFRAEGTIAALKARREEIVMARQGAEGTLRRLRSDLVRQLRERLSRIDHEARPLLAEVARLRSRHEAGRIAAPRAGRVRMLTGLGVGMAIAAGIPLMEIVPRPGDRQLLVELLARDSSLFAEGSVISLLLPHPGRVAAGFRPREDEMRVVIRRIVSRPGSDGRIRHVLRLTMQEHEAAREPLRPGTPVTLRTSPVERRGLALLLGPIRELMAGWVEKPPRPPPDRAPP